MCTVFYMIDLSDIFQHVSGQVDDVHRRKITGKIRLVLDIGVRDGGIRSWDSEVSVITRRGKTTDNSV